MAAKWLFVRQSTAFKALMWAWCNCRQVHVSLNGGNNQRAASFQVVLLRDWQKGNC